MEQPELPNLKKKEKERKKGGLAWSWGQAGKQAAEAGGGLGEAAGGLGEAGGGAGELAGEGLAAEGLGASGSGAEAAGILEAQAGRSMASGLMGRLLSTAVGKLAAGALAAVVLSGAALLAYRALFGRASGSASSGLASSLGVPDIGPRLRGPGRSGLQYLEGHLGYGQSAAVRAPQQQAAQTAKAAAPAQTAAPTTPSEASNPGDDAWRRDRLAHDLSMAHLSTSLGGDFGNKNIFSSAGAPKFGAVGGIDRGRLADLLDKHGKSAAMKRPGVVRSLSGGHLARLGAQRAIGQLKAARTLSTAAGKSKTTTTDAASTLASNAFDSGAIGGGGTTDGGAGTGGSTSGGGTSGAGGGGGGTIDPGTLGSGSATDVTAPTGSGVNATPYQQALDAIHQMAQKAAQMKSTGMMLLIAGAILVGIGAWMMTTVWGAVYGAVLVGIGSLIIGMGAMMMMMAGQLASQAKQMASQIEQQYGQSDTSQALQQCVDQALNNPQQQNCDKAKNVDPNSSATQQQVNQESQSGYTVGTEDGQPMGNTGGGQSQGQSQQKALGAGH